VNSALPKKGRSAESSSEWVKRTTYQYEDSILDGQLDDCKHLESV
jgi:hypothetical protein